MNRPQIIALTGPASCGKDTAADLLATHAKFCKLAFADPLRAEVVEAFGVDMQMLTRRDTKETPTEQLALRNCSAMGFLGAIGAHLSANGGHPPAGWLEVPRSPRQIMQWWGTEYRRRQNPDFWASALANRIKVRIETGVWRFVISDLRFPNEAAAIRQLGGQVWQIQRPGFGTTTGHSSDVDGSALRPDVVLINSRDVPHLQRLVLAEWWSRDIGLDKSEFALIADALAVSA